MLQKLRIRNFALIQELDIDLRSGLTMITGETGAGKSILLGALDLLLGGRADTSRIQEKSVLEAEFDLSGLALHHFFEEHDLDEQPICIIRREIAANGKSRGFINDTPVSLQQMKSLGQFLVDIHSQHDTLLLHERGFRLRIADAHAGCATALKTYQDAFQNWKQKRLRFEQLSEQALRLQQEQDFLRFQVDELHQAQLVPGELAQLEHEFQRLSHATEIGQLLSQAEHIVDGDQDSIQQGMQHVQSLLRQLQKFSPEYEALQHRFIALSEEWKDWTADLAQATLKVEINPHRLEQVSERIDQINRLLQKHRVGEEEALLHLQAQLEKRLNEAEHVQEDLVQLELEVKKAAEEVSQTGVALREQRRKGAPKLEAEVMQMLHRLGMPKAVFQLEYRDKAQPSEDGLDDLAMMFSANPGNPPQELSKVASGGELSRLMFALKKAMASKVALPTLIFDEIDTGISGAVADSMAEMMLEMAKSMQVITITHLPQIASKGQDHLKVSKAVEGQHTRTRLQRLNKQERIAEIAAMLSGKDLSDAAIGNARALLNLQE